MTTEISASDRLTDITPHVSDADFGKLAKSNKFLPRIQLFGSQSKLVQMGKMPQNHWGLVKSKDNVDDLGASFDCVVIQYRSKALDMTGEKPVQFFDQHSNEFMSVVDRSTEEDSGCMWGPEFLFWLPREQTFATMFCHNPTMRNSAEDIKKLFGRGCTLGVRLIQNKKFTWPGPNVSICSTPQTMPDRAWIHDENDKFTKVQSVEPVEDAEDVEESGRAR